MANGDSFYTNQYGKIIIEIEYSKNRRFTMDQLRTEHDYFLKILKQDNGVDLLINSLNYYMIEGVARVRDDFIIQKGKSILPKLKSAIGVDYLCDLPNGWKCFTKEFRDTRIKQLVEDISELNKTK